jgi:hypothetical protein
MQQDLARETEWCQGWEWFDLSQGTASWLRHTSRNMAWPLTLNKYCVATVYSKLPDICYSISLAYCLLLKYHVQCDIRGYHCGFATTGVFWDAALCRCGYNSWRFERLKGLLKFRAVQEEGTMISVGCLILNLKGLRSFETSGPVTPMTQRDVPYDSLQLLMLPRRRQIWRTVKTNSGSNAWFHNLLKMSYRGKWVAVPCTVSVKVKLASRCLGALAKLRKWILAWSYLMFCWTCIAVCQYSETNVMHFLLNLSSSKSLYMFRVLLAHLQEALHKLHLVYCVRVKSVGCASFTPILVQPTDITHMQYTKCLLCSASWRWGSSARNM